MLSTKNQTPSKLYLLIFFLCLTTGFALFKVPILGQSFFSPSYHIEWGNFNITSGKKSSATYSLTDTVGQIAPGRFTSDGYVVKSGFQYIYEPRNKFSFSINDLNIDFGALTPNVGTTDTNIITVTTPSGRGYQILTAQNHPLINQSGGTIPDTACDSGTCTPSSSGVWSQNTTYGFGFNAIGINSSGVDTGIGTSTAFTNRTYYRPFANRAINVSSQVVMEESLPVKDRQARITYKANISPLQQHGSYENSVYFIAIPKY